MRNGKALARGEVLGDRDDDHAARAGSRCGGAGTYAWKRSGKTMTFIRKREAALLPGAGGGLSHIASRRCA